MTEFFSLLKYFQLSRLVEIYFRITLDFILVKRVQFDRLLNVISRNTR